ncbi:hypothetical protein [Curtobacterium sp. PhB146]|uniref:hypothetical protein n=1 Tax=Curtobacterium sp. PhB146 TaxID=2485187 RepID=UPI001051E7E6|nr:hypothetical protein [Curtobacterium sp. PhB146]TCU48334.1 hypothetical protein EDF33_102225 [Curtobacterium sp. PhB146]
MTDHETAGKELIGELRRVAESRRTTGENHLSGLLRSASDALAWHMARLARAARLSESSAGGPLRGQAGGVTSSTAGGIGATLRALGIAVRAGEFAHASGPTIRLDVGDMSLDLNARQTAALRLALTHAQQGSTIQ